MKGVAFKVTYNDGGAVGGLIGYKGVCSDRIIAHNVLGDPAVWCSQNKNQCSAYARSGFKGLRPRIRDNEGPCYESTLLQRRPFRFGAGVYHHGPRKDEAIPIRGAASGDVAFLTTRLPDQDERDRIVFGCFRIGQIMSDEKWGNVVESDGQMDVQLPDDVARTLRYWNYQDRNADGSTLWGAGLFRYMNSGKTIALLEDLLARLGSSDERDRILLATKLAPKARQRLPEGQPTGEGMAHRELKMRVAADPTLLGLPRRSVPEVESVFATGDRVDIRFTLPDGTAAVVEIETFYTLMGAHQAVKYRALAQVERGEPLGSNHVRAFVVAYQFDEPTRQLASAYNITLVQLPPPQRIP